MVNNVKFWIGPMSKNIVDSVIEFNDDIFGFIPSRRQIDYMGGYVNNWNTKQFAEYVDGKVLIERDHGGPCQSVEYYINDGMESFKEDVKYFDIIHVDPFKKFQVFTSGIYVTMGYIERLLKLNSNIKFEIGTEQSILEYDCVDCIRFILTMKNILLENIEYIVIQSGVGLDLLNQKNIGIYDESRLIKMLDICKKYDVKSKEHNGDYLTNKQIKRRFDLGLDAINIAPQFGQIETQCYIEEMNKQQIMNYYQLCYNSGRWEKWISKDEANNASVEKLILVCGHYLFSNDQFKNFKPNIDEKIKKRITEKLISLRSIIE